MKARLLFKDQDFDPNAKLCPQEAALTQDLEFDTLFAAMAEADPFLRDVVRKVLLAASTATVAQIRYRQAILQDCIRRSKIIVEIYAIAVEALQEEKKIHVGIFDRAPEAVLRRSVIVLEMFTQKLRRLRGVIDEHGAGFASEGFSTLFETLRRELDDAYFARVEEHLKALKFRRGIQISAELGPGNKGVNYILRKSNEPTDWFSRWFNSWFGPGLRGYTLYLEPRDEAGARAFSELRDRASALAAGVVAQSVDHVLSFFQMLRTELAFYVGGVNLHDRLSTAGCAICMPNPTVLGESRFSCDALYDICLALGLKRPIASNTVRANGKRLVIVTGANQGGKSTFLRSVGLAQLMMQAGLFVPAKAFCADIVSAVFTHYRREEDRGMRSGKFDEELGRMSGLVDLIHPNALLLFNESFASTNEREGSEIAGQIVRALLECGNKVVFVTHMFALAENFRRLERGDTIFLRAERAADGARTFQLVEGRPLPTSFGEDLYRAVFVDQNAAELKRSAEPGKDDFSDKKQFSDSAKEAANF